MAYRTFTDGTGTEWQVCDIIPQLSERRSRNVDRRVELRTIPFDRREDQRRLTRSRRSILRGTYATGWLCFASDKEKCRLSPIPRDWAVCSDERMEEYLRRAERVAGTRQPMVGDCEGELAEAG